MHRCVAVRYLAALAVIVLHTSCRVTAMFHCERDEQCRGGDDGRCEPAGVCSFADPSCASGRRYDELAGGGLASACVGGGTDVGACFARIAGGEHHICVLRTDGTVWCWGRNTESQLTSELSAPQQTPAQLAALPARIKRVVAGDRSTCVRLADDTLRCFGRNTAGQIGNGTSGNNVAMPVEPSGLGAVLDFAAGGEHSCAIRAADAKVYCWGRGSEGQLGTGNLNPATTPQEVQLASGGPLVGATAIAAGFRHTCALAGGTVYCWGFDNNGQLGDDPAAVNQSVAVSVMADVAAIACGRNHSCAHKLDGTTWCWGSNSAGQVGDGTPTGSKFQPVAVVNLPASAAIAFALGDHHSCALVESTLWCWGGNAVGEVADPASTSIVPAAITDLGAPERLAATRQNTCAIEGSAVTCRGGNDQYQLAFGPPDATGPAFHPPTAVDVPCD